jgi:hypothetical protein
MANKWLAFLSQYRKKHSGMSLKQAMKAASSEYKKSNGTSKPKAKGKKKNAKK